MSNNVLVGSDSTWTTVSNWTAGHAPTTNEDGFVTNDNIAITGGLNNASANLHSLNQVMDFTGQIGTNGSVNTYLQIGAVTVNLGLPIAGGGSGAGTRLFNLNSGTSSTLINVFNSANSGASVGQAPIKLLGSAMQVYVTGGIISIAALQTENATISKMSVVNGQNSINPNVFVGAGCNLGTLTLNGGIVSNASQLIVTNAHTARTATQLNHLGSGGYNTLQIDGGSKVTYTGSGSVNSLICSGIMDLSTGGGAVAFGSVAFYSGATFSDPLGRSTFGTPYTLVNCSLKDVNIDLGQGRVT